MDYHVQNERKACEEPAFACYVKILVWRLYSNQESSEGILIWQP